MTTSLDNKVQATRSEEDAKRSVRSFKKTSYVRPDTPCLADSRTSKPQYSGGMDCRAFMVRTWLSSLPTNPAKTATPKASITSEKLLNSFIATSVVPADKQSLHHVPISVNTARSYFGATLCGMSNEDRIRIAQGRRLAMAREAAGYNSARAAALGNGWAESSYRAHENGTRTIGQDDAERYARRFRAAGINVSARSILFGDTDMGEVIAENIVGVKGAISAGGSIDTDGEHIEPGANLFEITVPFPVPEGAIAFLVKGDSMYPRYDPDDVIVCSRPSDEPNRLIGFEAAVATPQGNRYLKKLLFGSQEGLFTLESHNAAPMRNVQISWASDIYAVVRAQHWQRLSERGKRRDVKKVLMPR